MNHNPHKEKATEIVEMFIDLIHEQEFTKFDDSYWETVQKAAKQCAVKYVDGKIEALSSLLSNVLVESCFSTDDILSLDELANWQQVKNEIEKL